MSYELKTERARTAMVAAEEELRGYFDGCVFDMAKEVQLSQAVRAAREEFLDQLESLCPRFPEAQA
jgi:hypothetical protein